jgi:hypothetical protein
VDRGGAYGLHPFEEGLPALLGQHLAYQGAKAAYVLAQGAVMGEEFGIACGFHQSLWSGTNPEST